MQVLRALGHGCCCSERRLRLRLLLAASARLSGGERFGLLRPAGGGEASRAHAPVGIGSTPPTPRLEVLLKGGGGQTDQPGFLQ